MEIHLSQKTYHKYSAFVLGNGTSRLSINPFSIISEGKIYGCNAQYREFTLNYLIAVDAKMINEIIDSQYHKTNEVWTNPNRGIKSKEHINFLNPHKGWSSGPTALWLASTHNYTDIYILGFDYVGVNKLVNNVYANTNNYKKSTATATFYGNWLAQTIKVIKEFKHINYYRVINKGNFIPDKLAALPNLTHITYKELTEKNPKIEVNS